MEGHQNQEQLHEQQQEEQQEQKPSDVINITVNKSKLIKIVAAVSAVIVLGIGGIAYYNYEVEQQRIQAEQQRIKAENEAKARYKKRMLTTADLMKQIATEAEFITGEYSKVWHDAIFNDFGVTVNGQTVTDFNLAVSLKQEELSTEIEYVKSSLDIINDSMKELNNPPKEYEEAYKYLLELHSITTKYVDMAVSPHGSLQEFNEEINQYSSDFVSTYNTFKTLVPGK